MIRGIITPGEAVRYFAKAASANHYATIECVVVRTTEGGKVTVREVSSGKLRSVHRESLGRPE